MLDFSFQSSFKFRFQRQRALNALTSQLSSQGMWLTPLVSFAAIGTQFFSLKNTVPRLHIMLFAAWLVGFTHSSAGLLYDSRYSQISAFWLQPLV
jgi:hypothetical protein